MDGGSPEGCRPAGEGPRFSMKDALRDLDRLREAAVARHTLGLSPESLMLAWFDWSMHLAAAPGKRLGLALSALESCIRAWSEVPPGNWWAARAPSGEGIEFGDPRFSAPAWQRAPFRQSALNFLRMQRWWHEATHDVPGAMPHHEQVVSFVCRQWLDLLSPSNHPWSHPEVLRRTADEAGMNFWRGGLHGWQDVCRFLAGQPAAGLERFRVGREVAAAPGRVVLRNRLIELIQYTPTTSKVHAEPVLLVPAWIMKYYILDLSAENSLVKWLVSQGHTVFCISWRNVGEADRDLSLDDYRRLGVMAALDAVGRTFPKRKVHAAGYCLGGTLMAIAAAAMARAGDSRLASLTLLAAQTDFTEAGELQLFIDPSQVHMLDSMMWQRGYLAAEQMSGAFQMLRSNDLIASRVLHDYLMGERRPASDLMAWNADSTRMPHRMHSEYLHRLFLDNDLAAGRYCVEGHPVALQNIRVPIFAVGTERDHVAPWRSVYKIHQLIDTEVTFALTSGGHNAGIVNPPGLPGRHHRVSTRPADAIGIGPDEWLHGQAVRGGSWWPAWGRWLARHSSARRVPPPRAGATAALGDAPGLYVLERS